MEAGGEQLTVNQENVVHNRFFRTYLCLEQSERNDRKYGRMLPDL